MMGQREDWQGQLTYEYNLDAVVRPDHLVRRVHTGPTVDHDPDARPNSPASRL
jgi:hypothetical protein